MGGDSRGNFVHFASVMRKMARALAGETCVIGTIAHRHRVLTKTMVETTLRLPQEMLNLSLFPATILSFKNNYVQ